MSGVVTIALPQASLSVLALASAIALLCGAVWLMLDSFRRDRRAPTLDTLLIALGVVLAPVWLWLLGAVIWVLHGETSCCFEGRTCWSQPAEDATALSVRNARSGRRCFT